MNPYLAIFDLDETLVNCKSLFEVFKYYCSKCKSDEFRNKHDSLFSSLREMVSNGFSRDEINKYFYRNFAGISRKEMSDLSQEWFDLNKNSPDFFCSSVLRELEKHRKNNAEIIIVSGSFVECVQSIANFLDISRYICINLEKKNDFFTGEIIGTQTIGEGKAQEIKKYVLNKRRSLNGSYAYTDHISDLPLLELVDNPVVVGGDVELLHLANTNGWKIIKRVNK